MDIELQKGTIQQCQPISKDELLKTNKTVCIIPLSWWTKWCLYVGFFGIQTGECPEFIDTGSINIHDTSSHAYISKQAWKHLKSWYNAGLKIEVAIVKDCVDTNSVHVSVMIDAIRIRKAVISLQMPIFQIKEYLCNKYNKDPYWNRFIIKKSSGLQVKLKKLDTYFTKEDITDATLIIKKAKRLQSNIGNVIEDDVITSCENKNEYTINCQDNIDIEMEEINHHEYNHHEYDHQNLLEIKQQVSQALLAEKQYIRIKSLKHLQKNIEIIGTIIDNLNNIQ